MFEKILQSRGFPGGSCLCAVLSRSVVSDSLGPHGLQPVRLLCPWGFSRQEYWGGLHALHQGIFPTQKSNPGLPHCKQILNSLSHQGSSVIKNLLCCGFDPWVRKIPWRRAQQATPVFLPGKSHGQSSPADNSPEGRKKLDTTEVLNKIKLQCKFFPSATFL